MLLHGCRHIALVYLTFMYSIFPTSFVNKGPCEKIFIGELLLFFYTVVAITSSLLTVVAVGIEL